MKLFLTLIALLLGLPAFGQSTWRNFFTTNQNPIVEVVAGSNATVQASTVGVNLRRFTVNSTASGGSQTNISWTGVTNLQSAQVPLSVITNAQNLTNWALIPTNYTPLKATYASDVSTNQLPQSAITNQRPGNITFSFDGGSAAIQSGTRGSAKILYTGTIVDCTLMAYPSGSIELRLWRTNSADASFPPTAVGSIGTNALTSDSYNIDATLTGWTTLVSSGDVFTVNIPTNALSITNLTMTLKVQP